MISNTKCECGHQNHVGTVLCESCGKPLGEEMHTNEPLEMRYDGVARRSQKANPGVIDRVWNFFSSVKIAVYLIIFTLLASMLGTIYPQESTFLNIDPSTYYENTYGFWGKVYYTLGLSRTYESWWFIGLLVMIGTSLVVCSLDRVLPLYRALSKQQIRKHMSFLTRQKVVYQGEVPGGEQAFLDSFSTALARRRYKVHRDGPALLAEKNRFSRWGPYINHIGLILFLLAVLARSIPGWYMDEYVLIPEGEAVELKNTNYYLKNEQVTIQYYTDEELPESLKGTLRAKFYETKAVLYECTANCNDVTQEPVLEEVKRHDIQMNQPLNHEGLLVYQFDFNDPLQLKTVRPMLINKQTGEQYGPFELDMRNPQTRFEVGPYVLELRQQFMEFAIGADGSPTTLSREPRAPAFGFVIKGPDLPEAGETYLYFPREIDKVRFSQDAINGEMAQRFDIRVDGMDNIELAGISSFLNVRMDRAISYVWIGAVISMIGLVMGFYWQHRRIWLRIDNSILTLGAYTNKNWFGMRADTAAALKQAGIVVDPKQLDNGGNST